MNFVLEQNIFTDSYIIFLQYNTFWLVSLNKIFILFSLSITQKQQWNLKRKRENKIAVYEITSTNEFDRI